jgi:hypothetical protein
MKFWSGNIYDLVSEDELSFIPEFRRKFRMFTSLVFTIQLFQTVSMIAACRQFNNSIYFSIALIMILSVTARTFYFLYINHRVPFRILTIAMISIIAIVNGVFFLFYYFKDELIIFNLGRASNGSFWEDFGQLKQLILSERMYQTFSVIILVFFQVICLIPFLILDNESIRILNQLKHINGTIRSKGKVK